LIITNTVVKLTFMAKFLWIVNMFITLESGPTK